MSDTRQITRRHAQSGRCRRLAVRSVVPRGRADADRIEQYGAREVRQRLAGAFLNELSDQRGRRRAVNPAGTRVGHEGPAEDVAIAIRRPFHLDLAVGRVLVGNVLVPFETE